jgi:hypothetical protein
MKSNLVLNLMEQGQRLQVVLSAFAAYPESVAFWRLLHLPLIAGTAGDPAGV